MIILFHLGHPAHYHLFKNSIKYLQKNHKIFILIKKKEILEDILIEEKIPYINILPEGRKDSKVGILLGLIKNNNKIFSFCLKNKPNLLIGTSPNITHIGKLLNIPSLNFNEDDAAAVPLYAKLSYPFSTEIITPKSCNNNQWNSKSIKYDSYHELAYLHPNNFTPDKERIRKFIDLSKPYFLLRFSSLNAHHDKGVTGLGDELIEKIISILKVKGNIYITSERILNENLENYRLSIPLSDIHHAIYYASLYLGDSQTMAAEAAVLGTPSIRFNDFVGRLGYLEELEKKYGLTVGIKTIEADRLIETIKKFVDEKNLKENWQKKKEKMLSEKIDTAKFINWFIENYPASKKVMNENPAYQYNFK